MSFDKHIAEVIRRGNQIAGVIRRSFTHLTPSVFTRLFKAMARPHLEYAQAVWQPYKRMHIDAIEGVQRRATKQVIGLRNLEYPERLRRLDLPTLAFRHLRGDMVEVYKILHKAYDPSVDRDNIRLVQDEELEATV